MAVSGSVIAASARMHTVKTINVIIPLIISITPRFGLIPLW